MATKVYQDLYDIIFAVRSADIKRWCQNLMKKLKTVSCCLTWWQTVIVHASLHVRIATLKVSNTVVINTGNTVCWMVDIYYYTHLMALCLGLPGWAGTWKVKPVWISGAGDSEWQWHQLGHMQICTSPQTDNHVSTPPFRFLQARCPSCRPTNSVKALTAVDVID